MVCKILTRIRSTPSCAMLISSRCRWLVVGSLLAVIGGFASTARAQYETISYLQNSGGYNTSYTTTGVITQILSNPGVVNGVTYPYTRVLHSRRDW